MAAPALYGRASLPYRVPEGAALFSVACPIALVEHDLLDGRALEFSGERFELDVQGFQRETLASAVTDHADEAQITGVAFREVERLVLASVPGASRVFVFDHAVRTGGAALKAAPEGTQYYGSLVHCDCTTRSGWTRGREQALGSDEVLDKYGLWPATYESFADGATRPELDELFRAETKVRLPLNFDCFSADFRLIMGYF